MVKEVDSGDGGEVAVGCGEWNTAVSFSCKEAPPLKVVQLTQLTQAFNYPAGRYTTLTALHYALLHVVYSCSKWKLHVLKTFLEISGYRSHLSWIPSITQSTSYQGFIPNIAIL
jgi:hypothetical protein